MNFCSRASLAADERFAGTGVRGEAYVFLPVPKRLWRDKEMNRAWASAEELETLRAARRAGVVTRLYDTDGEDEAALVYTRDGVASDQVRALLSVVARRWRLDEARKPRLAICTHGTRDRCCAKWGFAAYRAARELFDAQASVFEPLQCSHLGGDRFAATGIFFPSGDMYAHLDDLDLAALAAAEAAGRLEPDHYRGRVFDAQLVQVVRAGLAKIGLLNDATAPLVLGPHAGPELEAECGGRRFHVRLDTAKVQFYGSCEDIDTGRTSTTRRTFVAAAEELGGHPP